MIKQIYITAILLLTLTLLCPHTTKAVDNVDVELKFISHTGENLDYSFTYQIIDSTTDTIIHEGNFNHFHNTPHKISIKPFVPYTVVIKIPIDARYIKMPNQHGLLISNDGNPSPILFTRPLRVGGNRVGEKAITYKLPKEIVKGLRILFFTFKSIKIDNPAHNPDDPRSKKYIYPKVWTAEPLFNPPLTLRITRKVENDGFIRQEEAIYEYYAYTDIINLPYGIYDIEVLDSRFQDKKLQNIVIKKDKLIKIFLKERKGLIEIPSKKVASLQYNCQKILAKYPTIFKYNRLRIGSLPIEAQECYYGIYADSIHNIPKELMKKISIIPYVWDRKTKERKTVSGIEIYATDKITNETMTFTLDENKTEIELPPNRFFYISAYKEGYDAGGTIEFYTGKKTQLTIYLKKLQEPRSSLADFPEDEKRSILVSVTDSLTKEPIHKGKFIVTSINYDFTEEYEFTNYQTILRLPPGNYTIKAQADNYIESTIREFRVIENRNLTPAPIKFTLLPIHATRKYIIDIKFCGEEPADKNSIDCIPPEAKGLTVLGLDEEEIFFFTKPEGATQNTKSVRKKYWDHTEKDYWEYSRGNTGNMVQSLVGEGIIRLEGELPLGQIFFIKSKLKIKWEDLEFKLRLPVMKIDTRPFAPKIVSCSQKDIGGILSINCDMKEKEEPKMGNVISVGSKNWQEPAKILLRATLKGKKYDIKLITKNHSTGEVEAIKNNFPIRIKGKTLISGFADIPPQKAGEIWLPDNANYEIQVTIPYEDVNAFLPIGDGYIDTNGVLYQNYTYQSLAGTIGNATKNTKSLYIKTPLNRSDIIIYTAQSSSYVATAFLDFSSIAVLYNQYSDPQKYNFNLKVKIKGPKNYSSSITKNNPIKFNKFDTPKPYSNFNNYESIYLSNNFRFRHLIGNYYPIAVEEIPPNTLMSASFYENIIHTMLPHVGDYMVEATLKIYNKETKKVIFKDTLYESFNVPDKSFLHFDKPTPETYRLYFLGQQQIYIAFNFTDFTANIYNYQFEPDYHTETITQPDGTKVEHRVTPKIRLSRITTRISTSTYAVTSPDVYKFYRAGHPNAIDEYSICNHPGCNWPAASFDLPDNPDNEITLYRTDGFPVRIPYYSVTTNLFVHPINFSNAQKIHYPGHEKTYRRIKIVISSDEPFSLSKLHIDPSKVKDDNFDELLKGNTKEFGKWENSYIEISKTYYENNEEKTTKIKKKLYGRGSATTHTKIIAVALEPGTYNVELFLPNNIKHTPDYTNNMLYISPDDPPDKEYILYFTLSPRHYKGTYKERFLILKLKSDKKDVGFKGVTPFINIGGTPIETIRSVTQGTKTDWFAYVGGTQIQLQVNPNNPFETIPVKIPLGYLAGGTVITYQAYTSETLSAMSRSYLGRALHNLKDLVDDIFSFKDVAPGISDAEAKKLYEKHSIEETVHRPRGGKITIPDDEQYIVRQILLPVGHGEGEDDDEIYDVEVTINAMSDQGFHSSYLDFLGIFTVTNAFSKSVKGLNALRKIGIKAADSWYEARKHHLTALGDDLLKALNSAQGKNFYTGKYIKYDKASDTISLTEAGKETISSAFQYKTIPKETLINKIQTEIDIAFRLSIANPQNTINNTYIANNFVKPLENTVKAFKTKDWHNAEANLLEKKIENVNKALNEFSQSKFGKMASQTKQIATAITQQPFTKALEYIEKVSKLNILTPIITTALPFMGLPPSGMPLIQLSSSVDKKMVIPENKEFTNTRKKLNEYLPGAGAIAGWLKNISIKPTKAEPIKVHLKVQKNKPIIIKAVAQGHTPYQATITPPPPSKDGTIPKLTLDITMIRNEGWMFQSTENFFNANPLLAERLEALFLSPEMFYGSSETPGVWDSFIESTANILFDSICKDLSNSCN